MSIRTLTTTAVQRDTGTPRRPGAIKAPTDASIPEAEATVPSSLTDSLISAIPTEILAPYTALIGFVVGLVTSPDGYLPLRWILYVASALLVAVAVLVLYRQKSGSSARFPLTEMLVATTAFAAWGLVMPGSPLQGAIDDNTTRAITSAVVAFGATVLLTLLGAPLTKERKTKGS